MGAGTDSEGGTASTALTGAANHIRPARSKLTTSKGVNQVARFCATCCACARGLNKNGKSHSK
jgi:hypothetical protein